MAKPHFGIIEYDPKKNNTFFDKSHLVKTQIKISSNRNSNP